MEVKNTPIESVIPYARNPRKNDEAAAKVAASLKEFGWQQPIVVDSDMVIIAGHTRLLAAQRLGMTEVPVAIADGLSPEQVKAYRLADNRVAQEAEWDNDLLALELADLKDFEYDLELTGFDDKELNALMSQGTEGLTDPDEVPEAPDDPVTVRGDIWELGNHRLMCGDSTSIDDVDALMGGQKADMVFTDPPYGVSYQSTQRTQSEKFDVLANDNTFLDVAPIISAASDGWVFVWTSWKVIDRWIQMFEGFGYPTNIVIWHKPGGGIGDLKKTFLSDYEAALVWNRGSELCGKRIGSVWKISKDGAGTYKHPTQKPVALSVEAIDKTTSAGSLVLDLFGGSGSTLIGAERTGRKSCLMELDEKYCDVIINRWQNFTGQDATLNGKTYAEVKDARQET